MPPHQSVPRLIRESLAVVTNIFNESWTRDGGGDLSSLGVRLEIGEKTHHKFTIIISLSDQIS